jgi:hypothetical protein
MDGVVLHAVPARFIVEWLENDGMIRTRTFRDRASATCYAARLQCRGEIDRYRDELWCRQGLAADVRERGGF